MLDCYSLLSKIYYSTKEYEKSIKYSQNALNLAQMLHFKEGIVNCYVSLANAHHKLEDFQSARRQFVQD